MIAVSRSLKDAPQDWITGKDVCTVPSDVQVATQMAAMLERSQILLRKV